MALPTLENWESTRHTLHQATQVVGEIRLADSPPLPNYLHYSVSVTRTGISTGTLQAGGELQFDMTTTELIYKRDGKTLLSTPVADHTQRSLMQAVQNSLHEVGVTLEPTLKSITHDEPFVWDAGLANDYNRVLQQAWRAIASFRAHLLGHMTPVVVFPHHFDISFLWFAEGHDEHEHPHVNFGFSPESPGFPRPYFYFYVYPEPDGVKDITLPAPGRWVDEPWSGAVLEYDAIRDSHDFEGDVMACFTVRSLTM